MKSALKNLEQYYILTPEAVKGLKKHYSFFKLLEDYYHDLIIKINEGERPILKYKDCGYDEKYGKIYFFLVIPKDSRCAEKVLNYENLDIITKDKYSCIYAVSPSFWKNK